MNKPIIDIAQIQSRNQLGFLLNQKFNSNDAGVEVGIHRGEYSKVLLDSWVGKLFGVDPYILDYCPGDPVSEQETRSSDYELAKQLEITYSKFRLLVGMSDQMVQRFKDNSLAFVYLDGNHTYEAFLQDLESWYPKVCSGGIIAGHDFICPNEVDGGWGRFIQKALFEFVSKLDDRPTIKLIPERHDPWSFYFEKPKQ